MIISYIYLAIIFGGIIYLARSKFPEEVEIKQKVDGEKLVSIIIPARNEERNIERLIKSLKNLNYTNYEILLVDGNSSDGTVEVAKQFAGVKIINEPERPEGWVGKPWGCYNGYKEARGEILLFTDADTWHAPSSLSTTVYELNNSDGFLSFVTTQEFKSFWEHMLSIVFLIISIATRGTRGTGKATIANGQYMMFTRETYEKLGTHKVVANSIIEDLAFATHAANEGLPPKIVVVKNLVTARMYQSLAEIQEGFGKNLGLGVNQAGFDSILVGFVMTGWGMGFLLVILAEWLIFGIITNWTIIIVLGGYTSFTVLLIFIEGKLSTKTTLYPLLYPIYFFVFQLIVINSIISTYLTKEIVWKDRAYKLE